MGWAKPALQLPKFLSCFFKAAPIPCTSHTLLRGTLGNSWRSQDLEAAVEEMEIFSSTQWSAVQVFFPSSFIPSLPLPCPRGKWYSAFWFFFPWCVCVKSFAHLRFCTLWEVCQHSIHLCQHWAEEKLSILTCKLTFHCAWMCILNLVSWRKSSCILINCCQARVPCW